MLRFNVLQTSRYRTSKMKLVSISLSIALLLTGCRAALHDSTVDVQSAVDAGGYVTFPAGIYSLTKTIVVSKSNTVIQGVGPDTVFVFEPTLPQSHCINDRAFTTPCDIVRTTRREIIGPIAVGAESFVAADDVSDLNSGDWLIIEEIDRNVGDVVVVDWAQVRSVIGNRIG